MGIIEAYLALTLNPSSPWHCLPTMPDHFENPPVESAPQSVHGAQGGLAAHGAHRLETLLVLSANPRTVMYREACPPYDAVPAVLVAERPDGRAVIVFLRGQNVVFDAAAQYGREQFGGWWPVGEG